MDEDTSILCCTHPFGNTSINGHKCSCKQNQGMTVADNMLKVRDLTYRSHPNVCILKWGIHIVHIAHVHDVRLCINHLKKLSV